jgi:predicted ribosomally synthesized peptide with nif11-like leader
MVTCDETALLISRGLDGDLSGAEAGMMYAHVAGCDACRRAMGEMAAMAEAMRAIGRHFDTATLDECFAAELAGKLDAEREESSVVQLRQFCRRAAQDDALRYKLQAARDHGGFILLCVQLGQENGYTFSVEQVESQLGSKAANDDELSDDQLDRVAAGTGFDGRKLLDILNGLD